METVAPLFTSLISLGMAIATLLRGSKDRLHGQFAWLAGVISMVFLFLYFVVSSREPGWRYALLFTALLVAPASHQLYARVLARYNPPFRKFVPVLYLVALVQAVIITVMGLNQVVVVANGLIVFGGLGLLIVGLVRLSRRLDRSIDRRRVNYLLWMGSLAAVTMALEVAFLDSSFFRDPELGRGVLFPPFGSLATAGYMYFLSQVMLRNRLLDRHEIVSRIVVFITMTLALAAIYGVLVRLIGRPTGPFAEGVNILIASILVLILFEPVKIFAAGLVGRVAESRHHDQVEALRELQLRIPGIIEVEPLLRAMFDGTMSSGRVDLASVYLYDESRHGYRLRRWEGEPEHTLRPAFAQHPFINGFQEGRACYVLEDLEADDVPDQLRPWRSPTVATMHSLQADLSLPLRIGATIVGVWNLRTKPGAEPFLEEELGLLASLADQAGVIIDNSNAFERMKEKDRLATLGQMAAGLAHEIRNPLGAIKGATQVLARGDSRRTEEFLGIIVEEVDRLDGVVGQFLDYARPMRMHVEAIPPGVLVGGVLAIIEAQGLPPGVHVEFEPNDDVPDVPMDVEKLKQVVLNMMLNGMDAMRRGGGVLRVSMRASDEGSTTRMTSLRTRAPGADRPEVRLKRGSVGTSRAVEIILEDEGEGITVDDANKLFIPFFTTKAQGTGLGLSICERIMREHGGEIEVESVPGEGTRFVLRLPVPDEEDSAEPADGSTPAAQTPSLQDAAAVERSRPAASTGRSMPGEGLPLTQPGAAPSPTADAEEAAQTAPGKPPPKASQR